MYSHRYHHAQIGPPTYYVRQQWDKGFKELIETIQNHISDMESEIDMSNMYVWLDLLAINPHSPGQQSTDLMSIQDSIENAKPTLVCMQQESQTSSKISDTFSSSSHYSNEKSQMIGSTGRAVLVMFRDRAGLRGFNRLRFDTVNIQYV